MAEEVRNSRQVIPRAMLTGVFINALLAVGFAITIMYTMGSLEAALQSPTNYPIIGIYKQATQSNHAATAMLCFGGLPGFVALFNGLASVTRLTWSFARDNGLPFSAFFVKISPHYRIPPRCLWLVSTVVALLSLINIGSTAAFNAILSLSAIALYFSYLIPIVFLLIKRFRAPHEIQWGPFCLGRWGLPINLFSIVWAVYILIFLPFPPTVPVTKENMNYAAPVFIGVLFFAVADWCLRGRHKWIGPVGKMAIE
jgi:choline transport protein